MNKIVYIMGRDSVTVYVDGRTVPISKGTPQYEGVVAAIKDNDMDRIRSIINVKQAVAEKTNGLVTIKDGELTFKGEVVHNALSDRILEMFRNGMDITPFTNFMINLDQNPSYRAVQELYGFLEATGCPITPDGHFLAYKMIKGDYTDLYTGTMDNSVGKIVEMPRNKVNEDKNQTCSQGLHFAGRYYVENGNYGSRGAGNRLVVVKVNPADVVSIPTDYNNAKGRACKYLILEEIEWSDRLPDLYAPDKTKEVEVESDDLDEDFDNAPTVSTSAKLDEATVIKIYNDLDNTDMSLTEIAKKYNISRRQVGRIRDGEVWGVLYMRHYNCSSP